MLKFQLKVYRVVGAVGITYMLDRLLALSVFFILEMIILLQQRCQSLSLDLELLRNCSGATEQFTQDVTSLLSVDQHQGVSTVSLELLQLTSIKGMAPVPR